VSNRTAGSRCSRTPTPAAASTRRTTSWREDGSIWSSAADGVHCFDPGGRLLGKILVPEVVANLCFGGPDRTRLFVTATQSLYTIDPAVAGL
jgi:sugar lactone lactonase YvrE